MYDALGRVEVVRFRRCLKFDRLIPTFLIREIGEMTIRFEIVQDGNSNISFVGSRCSQVSVLMEYGVFRDQPPSFICLIFLILINTAKSIKTYF